MTATLTSPTFALASGIVLKGIQWQTYQALVQDLESQPGKRLTYNNGVLEIRMPLPPHERYKKRLGRLVEVVTEELGVETDSLGSCTWSRQDLQQGIEQDECYYIQNQAAVRGKDLIDLLQDPPPDLAIEVDNTSSSVDRLGIYAALGVPEVWRYDLQSLTILVLVEGAYQAREQSLVLPLMTVGAIQTLLLSAPEMGGTSWARLVRQWVREQSPTIET
jgi:Uma2 family endonuclease